MAEVPQNQVTEKDLADWYKLKKELADVKAKEMLLRMKIFKSIFPAPKEGTNNHDLADGYVLKAQWGYNREVDLGSFTVLKESFEKHNIPADSLIQYKASLKKAEYNKLTEEERKLFDQALVIKPGSPTMEIVKPKKRTSAGTVNAGNVNN